jgi:hypothetical protein
MTAAWQRALSARVLRSSRYALLVSHRVIATGAHRLISLSRAADRLSYSLNRWLSSSIRPTKLWQFGSLRQMSVWWWWDVAVEVCAKAGTNPITVPTAEQ